MAFINRLVSGTVMPSFSERMANLKFMFKTVYEDASKLHAEMEDEIAKKKSQIVELQNNIEVINATKHEAETFMSEISKFL